MADPLPEGWTEEPVTPAVQTQEALPAGWTEEPVDEPAAAAPGVSERFKAVTGLTDPLAGAVQRDQEQQAQREELVRQAFKPEPGLTPELADAKVANHFGIGLELVKANRQGWLDAYAKDAGDPKKWIADNPLAARLIFEHPEHADDVVSNKEQNVLFKGINQVLDWGYDFINAVQSVVPASSVPEFLKAPPEIAAKETGSRTDVAAQLAGREKRDAPTQAVESDTPEARAIREQGAIAIARQRAKESRAGIELSVLYSKLGLARTAGRDTSVIEAQIRDAETKAQGLALGETGWTQALSDSWGQSQSSLDVLENVVKRGGAAAGFGAVVGAVGAFAFPPTRTPAGVFGGAVRGASIGAKAGGAEGAAERSFVLEFGDSYKQLLTTKTDAGEHLTEKEARGGAMIAASVKTGIELAELSMVMKALGPAGALFEKGGLEAVKAQLATNPGLRAMAVKAATAWAGEGIEEVTQEATDQVVNFLARSKHGELHVEPGPVFNPDKLKESGTMGLLGGLPIGLGSFVVSAGTHAVFQDRQARAATQAAEIAKLPMDPASAAMSGELAKLIADKSAEAGFPVTHMHVDAVAFKRLFQTSEEASTAATELMGESGPQQLVEAEQGGGRLVVPVAEYIERWGKDGVAEKLAKDTATSFEGLSQAQLEEKKKSDAAWAKSIAEASREPGTSPTLDRFDELEQQLVATGKATKGEARDALKPMRDVFNGFAKRFGQSVEDLFRNVRINIDDGVGKLLVEYKKANASERLSAQLHDGMTAKDAAEVLYVDPITELHTFEGFQQMQETEKSPSVISLTLTDIKPVNDSVLGGHGVSDALLRHVSPAIAAVDKVAARKGTNFILRGGPAELQTALANVQARLPKGMHVVGAVGTDAQTAIDAMDKKVDEGRASGALPKERSDTHAKLELLPQMEAEFEKAQAKRKAEGRSHRVKVTSQQVAAVAGMSKADFFKHAFQDKTVPGVLSHTGWDRIPRKAHVASIDIKGLKLINTLSEGMFGDKRLGDAVLKLFAEVARDFDGSDFDFSHLSGDEYAAQHDDPVKLQAWLDRVEAELLKRAVSYIIKGPDGEKRTEKAYAAIRAGIGEKTYGNADRVLNAAKLREKQGVLEGVRGAAATERGDLNRAPGGVQEAVPGGAVRSAAFEPRGAAPQGFIPRGAAQAVGVAARRLTQTDDETDANGFTDVAVSGIEKVYRIGLNAKANKSTFLHESGHVFLDLFRDLAARADAPASVTEDWKATLNWMGAKDAAELDTGGDWSAATAEQRAEFDPEGKFKNSAAGPAKWKARLEEKWARAFELYLATGEFPAARLAGPFQRFRLWMGAVYKKLSTLGEVSPEIKQVFDRLLATDEEIATQKRAMGLKAMPRETLGMSGEEYLAHLDELAQATAHARAATDYQVAKDQLRVTEAWWKAAKKEAETEAAADYEKLPARRAQLILQGQGSETFLGLNVPLNKTVVEAMVGAKDARKFRLSEDGVHPDEVVEMSEGELGYATGKDMLEAVVALPKQEDFVDARTDELMVERHPGVLDQRTFLRELVARGLHGAATKEWALKEWAALTARGPKGAPVMPPATIMKQAAELMVSGRSAQRVGGALDVHGAQVAERAAANAAQTAALKGDYAQAAVFKQKQVLNMFLHDELRGAQEEVSKFELLAARLSTLKARQRLGKGHPVYRDAVDQLLATFGLTEGHPGLPGSLDALLGDAERQMAEDAHSVSFDRARLVDRAGALGPQGWRGLALEDVRHIEKALKNIEAAARNRATLLIDGKRLDKEMTIAELVAEAETALAKRPDEPTTEAEDFTQSAGRRWNQFDGGLLKAETLARMLAGAKDTSAFIKSIWFRAVVEPLQKAKTLEGDLARQHLAPLIDAYKAMPKEASKRWMERFDGKKYFPNHVDAKLPARRFEVLMMLLNSGNESNLHRLTKGRGITEQQLRDAAIAVGVTKEEYAWLQTIWDTAEGLKPLAFDVEEQDSGVRPTAIPARAFDTPHGKMAGGYFPAVYDKVVTQTGKKQASTLAEYQDPSYTRPATAHSFTKERAKDFSDIISLSPSSIQRHFAQVIHDISHRTAIKTVASLMLSDTIQTTLRQRLGSGRAEQLPLWVRDVATMRGAAGSDGLSQLASFGAVLRGNIVTSALGYKAPNAAEDFTSNMLSAVQASDLKVRHLAAASYEFVSSPFATRALVLEKSGELRARQGQLHRELAKQMKHFTEGPWGKVFNQGPLGWFKEHAFAFAEVVEVVTGTSIWLGAYRQALQADPSNDAAAVTFADATVRQVMVSHSTTDLSAIMRDKGVVGNMLIFHGAFNHFYNQFRALQEAGDPKAARRLLAQQAAVKAGKWLGLSTALFLIGSLARGQGPDPDEPLEQWIFRKMALEGFMQMVPGGGAIGNVMADAMRGKMTSARNNSLVGVAGSVTDSIIKAARSGDGDKKVKAALQVLGPATGIPSGGPMQIVDRADSMLNWVLGD